MTVTDNRWEGLFWSEWLPLAGDIKVHRTIPRQAGVYRTRILSQETLAYIGQTGRDLRERIRALSLNLYRSDFEMPWNDPHTAAQSHWIWKQTEGFAYEVSVATTEIENRYRRGLEDSLLWRHRIETNCSTLFNYGRFHKRFCRSSPKKREARPSPDIG